MNRSDEPPLRIRSYVDRRDCGACGFRFRANDVLDLADDERRLEDLSDSGDRDLRND